MTQENTNQLSNFEIRSNELNQYFYGLSNCKSIKELETGHQIDCSSMKLRDFLRLSEVIELNENLSSCEKSIEKAEEEILNNLKKLADSMINGK